MSEKISNKKIWKTSLFVLSMLLVLAVVLIPIIDKQFKSSLLPELKDFAVEQPEEVTKIFMANKESKNSTLTLEKDARGIWMVNNEYPASEDKVKMLIFEYMARLRVKNPIPASGLENVKRSMAANATKVEIYKGTRLDKVYYVGFNAADDMGTHMYMEGSSVPFVVHIPEFRGYLSTVYNLDPKAWKSTRIFNTGVLDLASIRLEYPAETERSFLVSKKDKSLLIEPLLKEVQPKGTLDMNFLKQYAATFESLSYEGFFEGRAKMLADSVVKYSVPYVRMKVTDIKGMATTLDIYLKPVTSETKAQYDEKGNQLPYDLDRYYGVVNGKKEEVVSVQSFVFRNVLKYYDEFYR